MKNRKRRRIEWECHELRKVKLDFTAIRGWKMETTRRKGTITEGELNRLRIENKANTEGERRTKDVRK